jgi:hypothetical protein
MENMQELLQLASRIYDYECQGKQLSDSWYDFDKANTQDVKRLKHCSKESLDLLHTLSEHLEEQLQMSGATHQPLHHAYNIVQELIQSRTASQEMLENILKDDITYQEYFRALSIKEKAAVNQAKKLQETLSNLQ